jgi:hypothetical protein
MTYGSSPRSGSAPDGEEIKKARGVMSIRGFIRKPSSCPLLAKPVFQCHQCYQRNGTNIYEMAIITIVVFSAHDCNAWFGDRQSRPTRLLFRAAGDFLPPSLCARSCKPGAEGRLFALQDPSVHGHNQERQKKSS